MMIKNLIDEDFVNYKKPSMFIATSKCDFKCDRECGECVCQNSELAAAPEIEIDNYEIWTRFINNPITDAIVFGGLEPFDTFEDLGAFLLSLKYGLIFFSITFCFCKNVFNFKRGFLS